MSDRDQPSDLRRARIGLCFECRYARTIRSARGSEFWLCNRSIAEAIYPKYPPLPVLRCAGYERAPST